MDQGVLQQEYGGLGREIAALPLVVVQRHAHVVRQPPEQEPAQHRGRAQPQGHVVHQAREPGQHRGRAQLQAPAVHLVREPGQHHRRGQLRRHVVALQEVVHDLLHHHVQIHVREVVV